MSPPSTDRRAAAAAIDAFLRAIGRNEPELLGTGERVAELFLDDLCAGHAVDAGALVAEAKLASTSPGLVIVRDVHVVTTCPHHLLPAIGTATVAFRSKGHILGLGAVPALVSAHARRLVLQEDLGARIVADLDEQLAPVWVGCRIVLSHGCMIARGERAIGAAVETVALRCLPDDVVEAHRVLGVGTRSA